jgi:hypothetical protein
MTTNFFRIPTWLQRGHSAYTKVVEKGAARLAASPHLPTKRRPKKKAVKPAAHEKTGKQAHGGQERQQLIGIGYSPRYVDRLSGAKAKSIIADIIAGRGSQREDLG